MSKNIKITAFSLFILTGSLFGQGEYLIDIDYNLELLKKAQQEEITKNSRSHNKVYFVIDSINVPFVDDFSVNRITYNHLPLFPESAIKDSVGYNFKVDGVYMDSIRYMRETSWDYTYDSATNTLDSTAKPSFQISIFKEGPFPNNPFKPTEVFTAWPEYERKYIDSEGNLAASYVQPIVLHSHKVVDKVVFVSARNTLWIDDDIFINNSFADNPPTIGVAVFDGIRNNGLAYAPNQPNSHGIADHLTSKPLFLNYPASDSIYFSFYYQPQGKGNQPEVQDSLVLEFFSPSDSLWKWRWSAKGEAVHPFKQVMIPITQTEFLKDGFQFRFKNYASLSGNLDHWLVDYIRLDKNRSANDLNPEDVAFKAPANILLQNYMEMPWKQYKADPANEMFNSLTVDLRNNSSIGKVVNYTYSIKDQNNSVLLSNVSSGSASETSNFSYTNTLSFSFPTSGNAYEEFEIVNSINTAIDINRSNDTIKHIQRFDNYYAYDDGVPEAGYGINKMGAKLAYRFVLNTTDTLTAVRMHFTPINYSAEFYPFKLTIWSNLDDNKILHQESDFFYPKQTGIKHGFHEYTLSTPLVANGIIYVGWVQNNNIELNIGYDKNNNNQDKIFYNVSGSWVNSQYEGSLMIRPVFGSSKNPKVGIKEQLVNSGKEEVIKIYPNPAKNKIFIEGIADFTNTAVSLYDIYGRNLPVSNIQGMGSIDVSGFADGIYIIKIDNYLTGKSHSRKFVVNKQ